MQTFFKFYINYIIIIHITELKYLKEFIDVRSHTCAFLLSLFACNKIYFILFCNLLCHRKYKKQI